MGGFTAKDILLKIGEISPELAIALIFLALAVVITWKISSLVAVSTAAYKRLEERIEGTENNIVKEKKQRHKVEQLMTAAPCVSKSNGVWLQDESRNGGQPPEPIKCQYIEAKRKVE